MKKILILLFIALLFGCNMDSGNYIEPTENVTDNTPSESLPEVDPENPENSGAVVFGLYDGSDLTYYDGSTFNTAYTDKKIRQADNRVLSIEDILCYYDENGAVTASYQLPSVPDHILTVDSVSSGRSTIIGIDVWTFETIDPDTAQDLGAMKKTYTKIYKNSTEFSNWYLNEYEIKNVYAFENRLIIETTASALVNLSDAAVPFKCYSDLLITDVDYTNRKSIMNDVEVSFSQNYFYTSKWQKCGDIFQSQHGLVFNGTELYENATALQDFISMEWTNGQKYSLWPSGEREENSEYVSYWIDSTSGWLVRYVPSIDSYSFPVRLFIGSMNYADGNMTADTLDPVWIEDKLYFHESGSIYFYDPAYGTVQVFSDDQEIMEW